MKKNLDMQVWVLSRSSRGRPENVLGTIRINLPGTSLERQIKTSPGRHFRTSSGRPRDVRSGRPRDGQIGSLGDVLWTLEGDVLGTSWGPIFAGWVTLLGRISSEGFVMLIVIFVSSFCCCSSFAAIHSLLFMWCRTSFIAFQRHPSLFFHSFTASATILRGRFFTHRRFLPYAPSPTFYLVSQGLPGSR